MGTTASRLRQLSKTVVSRYGAAVLLTALALLIRWLLDPIIGARVPYVILLTVIALLSLSEGAGPAILASIVGLIGVLYWFEPPHGSGVFNSRVAVVSGGIYLLACGVIIAGGHVARRGRERLERARVLFETFLDNSPSVQFLKDLDGRYLYLSRAGRERHGADFAGKTDLDLVPADVAQRRRENDALVMREDAPRQFVGTLHEQDGEHTWLSVVFPITDADGRKLIGGSAIDITAQTRAEEEVRRLQQESAERAEAELAGITRLLEVSSQCMRDGKELRENLDAILAAAIELTRAAKGNLQLLDAASGALRIVAQRGFDEAFLTFFAEPSKGVCICNVAAGSKDRVVVQDVELSEFFAGTRSLDVLLDAGVRAVQSTPLVSSSGKVLGIISTHYAEPHRPTARELRLMDLLARQAADYLERKQTEEALAATSNHLRRFLEAAPTGLMHCSRDMRFLEVNSAYAQITGLPAGQIVGRTIVEVIGPKGWEAVRPYIERVLKGERVEYEVLLLYSAATPRHVHVVYTPEFNAEHEVIGWFASVTDTTQMKEAEERLRGIERMAAAGQLAATLAHEINNPLTSVTNLLYLLERQSGLDAETKGLISTAGAEIARVSRIVKQSLSYYRSRATAVEVDLAELVEESLQIFAARMESTGVEIRKKITPGTLVLGYADEMRQVIDNLLLNAEEAMLGGGRLTVSVRHTRNWKHRRAPAVRMTVADSGSGIPGERLPLIFEPFFTTKEEKGTGLGLWVVKGIVSKHEGTLKIRSREGAGRSGTVISILWPSAWREAETLHGPGRRGPGVERPERELADSQRARS